MNRHALLGSGAALAVILATSPARSAEPRADDDPAFRYQSHAPPDHPRGALEEVAILLAGYVEYNIDTSNARDQSLGLRWKDIRSKLVLDSLSLDNNRFGTNWLSHPAGGFLYYQAARSNRLGILESFAFAAAASTIWEFVGEIREQAAVNDLAVTPISGVPLGESWLQLGSFFQRSRRTPATVAGAWLFAPFKNAHDAIDGLTPQAPSTYDDLGLDADAWHRFRVEGSAGVTKQHDPRTWSDGRFALDTRLVTLPGYGRPGKHARIFSAGEVSTLGLRLGSSQGRVVDFQFGASVLPAGWFWQDIRETTSGGRRGRSVIVGLDVTAEYGSHDYDRASRLGPNLVADIGAGATVEHALYAGGVVLRTRADALFDFAGVDAFALDAYRRGFADQGLPSVLSNQNYYHAIGATLRPVVELDAGPLDVEAQVRVDLFDGIEGLDVEGTRVGDEVHASDTRTSARATIGVSPARHLRLFVTTERNTRAGRVGDVAASRSEVGLYGGVGVVF